MLRELLSFVSSDKSSLNVPRNVEQLFLRQAQDMSQRDKIS
jgi:hypothetical protein